METEREQLLRCGFVVLRGLVPPGAVDRMRTATDMLVERHKELNNTQADHAPGCFDGTCRWEHATLAIDRVGYRSGRRALRVLAWLGLGLGLGCSPYVEPLASAVGVSTAEWVDFWAGPASPVHAVSSALLGVGDASLASMEVLCQDPPPLDEPAAATTAQAAATRVGAPLSQPPPQRKWPGAEKTAQVGSVTLHVRRTLTVQR
jgi:hypothetical protein